MIEILKTMHKYIPEEANGKLDETIFGGDQLTCERCMNAQEDTRDAPYSYEMLSWIKTSY